MGTILHFWVDVDDAINAPDEDLWYFRNEKGVPLLPEEVRMHMKVARFEGKKCVPLSPCDNFDFQTGCKGHDLPDEEETLNH